MTFAEYNSLEIALTEDKIKLYEKVLLSVNTIEEWIKIVSLEKKEILQDFRAWVCGWPYKESKFKKINSISIDKNIFEKPLNNWDPYFLSENKTKLQPGTEYIFSYFNNVVEGKNFLTNIEKTIKNALSLDCVHLTIRNQKPGMVYAWHFDGMKNYYHNVWIKNYPNKNMLLFNRKSLWTYEKYIPQRFFIPLDDWHPGQLFQLGSTLWQGWKAGDILWYNWQTLPHATANASMYDRPMLVITGLTEVDYNNE